MRTLRHLQALEGISLFMAEMVVDGKSKRPAFSSRGAQTSLQRIR